MSISSLLPDVASEHVAESANPLEWIGMEKIAIPVCIPVKDELQQVGAKASLYVNLDQRDVKGIHMSRLHLALNQKLAGKSLAPEQLGDLLRCMVDSHAQISSSARVVLAFDMVLKKAALLSGEHAYQSYPVRIDAQLIEDKVHLKLELLIPYSSTCPCSAALSRQLYAEAVNEHFVDARISKEELISWIVSEAGSIATPHSQRSYANLSLTLAEDYWPNIEALILQFEEIIGTPVQTAVKRQDEQEFARLNATNLMFCEDAARRLKSSLDKMAFVLDYHIKVEHQESLHAHNAVVLDQKNPV
jgi:GTP cyclohydrolase I